MLKTGLNIAHFKRHVEIIEEETKDYFKRWGHSGERSNDILFISISGQCVGMFLQDLFQMFLVLRRLTLVCVSSDLFEALSELIILTASRCLHGPEIRSMLNERVAQLYADLDGGFTHAAWLLPGWLPLPSFRCVHKRRYIIIHVTKRDVAVCCCVFSDGEIKLT